MTLSNNHNGKVTQTESVDFIFDAFKKVNELIGTLNFAELTIDKANTNSFYIAFDKEEKSFEIRISNHTKRMQSNEEMEVISVQKVQGCFDTYNMNVFNAESLEMVLASLKTF